MKKGTLATLALCAVMAASVFADAKSDALLRATQNNNAAEAIRLINAGADVNATTKDGQTALMWATKHNAVDIMQLLIKAGAKVNAQDFNAQGKKNRTALMYTSETNAVDAARLLLASGADVNIKQPFGETALWHAVYDNRPELVDMFIAAGADVKANDIGFVKVGSILMYAAEANLSAIIKKLIAAGADVNLRQEYGQTALMWAAKANAVDAIQALLAAGADINVLSNYDSIYQQSSGTALMHAVRENKLDAEKALIKAGADMNIRSDDYDGYTALILAARKSDKIAVDMVQALIDAGADVNAKDKHGMDALGYAKNATVKNMLKKASAAQANDMAKESTRRKTEDEYLRNSANEETMRWIKSHDERRDAMYETFKKSIEGWANYPSEGVSKPAKELCQYFKDSNIDMKLPFDKKTELYANFIKDMEGKYASHVKLFHKETDVKSIKKVNEEIIKLTKQLK